MKNFERVYKQVIANAKMINENLDSADQRYEVYEGSEEDLIYIADLNSQCTRLQQRIMDGDQCVLKYIGYADDINNMGMNATAVGDNDIDGERSPLYILDSPTDEFDTQPVFVLS